MFLSRAFGRCARNHHDRVTLRVAPCQSIRLSTLRLPTSRVPEARPLPLRHQGARYASGPGPAYRYPENLNVFNSGTAPVVMNGTIRIVCIVVAAYGTFYFAPALFMDEAAPWWLSPLMVVGACVPWIATGIFFGGYVHHINLLLPKTARRTQDDLKRFVSNMPPNAIVQVKSMWIKPWPTTKHVFFEDFRRLPQSKVRLSNLESAPKSNVEVEHRSNPMTYWLVKKIMGSYFVNMNMRTDRSRAPGLWKTVWEQIPMAGERSMVKEAAEKRAVLASNRPVPVARQERSLPRGILEKKALPRANTSSSVAAKKASKRPKS